MRVSERRQTNRNFTVFWVGQTLSSVGDAVALIALPLLVLQATGSVARMGLVAGVSGVGQIVGGVVAGPLADRLDRRRFMLACDLARAALYAVVPLVWAAGGHGCRCCSSSPSRVHSLVCAFRSRTSPRSPTLSMPTG